MSLKSMAASESTPAVTPPCAPPNPDVVQESLEKHRAGSANSSYGSTGYSRQASMLSKASGRSISVKTPNTFHDDMMNMVPGSVPHSILVALVIGTVCGTAAWLYYMTLEFLLDYLWKELPEKILPEFVPDIFWIPILGFTMAIGVGLTVVYMGEPGDLPYTVKCVHEKAYVSMDHVLPMIAASQFSILGGGSLGPEAPLVAICAALGGFISRSLFKTTERNLIRKHTLMGMAGALAAFFGVPLGGSLFALEVNSRFGIEYFEHTIEAIFCGEVTLVTFRALAKLPIQPIWQITEFKLPNSAPSHVLYGVILGLIGAFVAWIFTKFHFKLVMASFRKYKLLDNRFAVQRGLIGAVVILGLGVMIPQTLFWGEYEFQSIATMSDSSTLEHVWPTTGVFNFQMDSGWNALILGLAKLVAISFTVAGGYRGGFIFPLFTVGAALGRAIFYVLPFIPVQLCVLCMAAAINVAVTRTSLATTLILAYLAGDPNTISSILAASLVSLFATAYMPFIASQVSRMDMEESLFVWTDDDEERSNSCETEELTPLAEFHKGNGQTATMEV